ncbi:MAG: DUF2510 domain-containing protein [Actinomycetota bacterium]
MTTPAGWYDDPMVPGGKRYWDGLQWTENAQAPPAVAQPGFGTPPPAPGPPPFATPAPGYGAPAVAGGPTFDGRINDIGDWLGRSFRVFGANIVPLSGFVLLQLAGFVMAYIMLDQALGDTALIVDTGEFIGLNGGLLVAAGVMGLVGALLSAAGWLAAHDLLYAAHVGQRPSWGASLGMGFRRLPRYIAIMIGVYLSFYLVAAVIVGLLVGIGALVGEDAAIILVPLFILLYVGFLAGSLWLSVKLVFLPVTAVVVPSGQSAFRATWNTPKGRFWPVLGRVLLLFLLIGLLIAIPYFVMLFVIPGLIFSRLEVLADGTLAIDGQDVDTIDVLEFSSVLPNVGAMVATILVIGYLFTMIYLVGASAVSALYADLGGPNRFGHRQP